jgi:uncharacterized membrane protein YsdA (DUF1294 family)
VPWVYGLASVIAFGLYAVDKATALDRAWRIPESSLLLAGLLAGWPGALLAQHLLRHKSAKPAYLAEFWATVALNVLAFAFAFTPLWRLLAQG